ncbi:gliding motility-associated-like protein [Thermoflavifilum aggregans]|uniref:Gliding motility-associated-like protein n=1 Tax=Thermoflavifilum aggregans TaxID=454188 RepID=A0A2M9CXB2_9BACT|nr:PKD domain-containing protein [Thermoflavifilum aggregans]PJJ76535.1 gliding motility-associated-like protein [Thermoflavifilum aggregans]
MRNRRILRSVLPVLSAWMWMAVFVLGIRHSSAQLNAAFQADTTQGCAPVVVHFVDQSTGPIVSRYWDFGNGNHIRYDSLVNPSATYINPGYYNVSLTVTDAAGHSSTQTLQVAVFGTPQVRFTQSDTTGCLPLTVHFTDLSRPGSGSITQWLWDFGDGHTSTDRNPTYTYQNPGNYTIQLMVTNSYGCTAVSDTPGHVRVPGRLAVAFQADSTISCTAPLTVHFTNTTTGPDTLSWLWDFGDGTISTDRNPVHTYTRSGQFSVKLVVHSTVGCIDSVVKTNYIQVAQAVPPVVQIPSPICAGSVALFTNITSPVPMRSQWRFIPDPSGGTGDTGLQVKKIFPTPGSYQLQVINTYAGGCSDTLIRWFDVEALPVADFRANPRMGCALPFAVSFTSLSSGAVAYQWDFGDGTTDTAANPVHQYKQYGNYTVKLIVRNAAGCTDTLVRMAYVQIQPPTAQLYASADHGCVPQAIRFWANVNSLDSVVRAVWDFGDSTSDTGLSVNHVYTTEGIYIVKFTLTTSQGCTQTFQYPTAIRVGSPPAVNFSGNPTDACAETTIHFTDLSDKGEQWLWLFGDGGTSTLQNPAHVYGDTGYFTVSLIVTHLGCTDTLTRPRYIHIHPPIAAFAIQRNCSTPYTIQFLDRSVDAIRYQWDFGDTASGTANYDTIPNPVHVFSATGTYVVTLTVSNDTCTYTTRQTLQIIDEHPDFTVSDSLICRKNQVTLQATNIHPSLIKSYQWIYAGPASGSTTTTQPNVQFSFSQPGKYSFTLITTDLNNCQDTVRHDSAVQVIGPTADFSVCSQGCAQVALPFQDLSQPHGSPLARWVWDFGDGIRDTILANDSSAATGGSTSHMYRNPGTYSVQLWVTDSSGCTDQITKPGGGLQISQVQARFYSPDTFSCPGKPVQFVNQSTGALSQIRWTFGDGSSGTQASPTHVYDTDGVYDVGLWIANSFGCSDSLYRPQYIHIATPHAAFSINNLPDSGGVKCPPFVAQFENKSTNYAQLQWDFGDGGTSVIANPTHIYNFPGTYTIRLVATSYGGCTDTARLTFTIHGPVAQIMHQPMAGCGLPVTIQFKATGKNAISYQWDFGDGVVSPPTTDTLINHTYTQRGNYKPVLIVRDSTGCSVSFRNEDSLIIDQLAAGFIMKPHVVCDSGYVDVQDTSHSFAADTLGLPNQLLWDFGDPSTTADTSSQPRASYRYRKPGDYVVRLTVTTYFGCQQTVTDTVHVVGTTHVGILGPDSACFGTPMSFTAQLLNAYKPIQSWYWDFGNGEIDTSAAPPAQNYPSAGVFDVKLIATNQDGCKDTARHAVTIFPLPVPAAGALDSVICLGNSTTLHARDGVQYHWWPAVGLNDTAIANPVASPVHDILYHVQVTNVHGCTQVDSVPVRVSQPFAMRVGVDTTICAGESVQLFAKGGAASYRWTPPTYLDHPESAQPLCRPDSSITYRIVGYGHDACFTDTGYVHIQVIPLPKVQATGDQTLVVGSQVQLQANGSPDVVSYQWSPPDWLSCTDCANPVATPRGNITYRVVAANALGCVAIATTRIKLICSSGVVFIPNTFSPNGDQQNDIFYPRGKGIQIVRYFRIFNRWGQLMFERDNFPIDDKSFGWDGTFKGAALPPDVYVYVTEMVCDNGEVFQLKGNVTLLR